MCLFRNAQFRKEKLDSIAVYEWLLDKKATSRNLSLFFFFRLQLLPTFRYGDVAFFQLRQRSQTPVVTACCLRNEVGLHAMKSFFIQ